MMNFELFEQMLVTDAIDSIWRNVTDKGEKLAVNHMRNNGGMIATPYEEMMKSENGYADYNAYLMTELYTILKANQKG